jgi:hypothetical protein
VSNLTRTLIVIACLIALYYLVAVLARSFVQRDVPRPPPPALEEPAGQDAVAAPVVRQAPAE